MAQRFEMKVLLPDPRGVEVPTLFSNHVAISRAGTEVQLEFVAVDINSVATKLNEKRENPDMVLEVAGKTVAKIVIPLHVFMQLESHLQGIFEQVKRELATPEVHEVHQ